MRRLPVVAEDPAIIAELERIRRLSDLANRANVNGGFMSGMPRPIPAVCANRRCGFHWCGRDAIRAPSLEMCRCFWCGSKLVPLTAASLPRQGELPLEKAR